jgi:hypothetical protein
MTALSDRVIPVKRIDHELCVYLLTVAASVLLWMFIFSTGLGGIQQFQYWPLILHAFLPVFLFRNWLGRVAFALTAAAITGLVWWLNDIKIDLTQMPLTWSDLSVFGLNPDASLREVKLSPALHYMVLFSVPCLALAWAGMVIYGFVRGGELLVRTVCVCAVFFSGGLLYKDFVSAADSARRQGLVEVWSPMALKVLSERFGALGFLAYSRTLDGEPAGPYFTASNAAAPSGADVDAAMKTIVLPATGNSQLPNIAIVMAESTFDPNRSLKLSRPFRSMLFDRQPLTHALGPLFVTPIGGGTWMSEFEVLTGMDSRLFGFHGRYTHTMLAPLVKRTLVHAMREQGYVTTAYYASQANFFNIGKAMEYYGFERNYPGTALGLNTKGWNITDPGLMDAALAIARKDERKGPVFNYFQLVENHSPHSCKKRDTSYQQEITLTGPATKAHNCQLDTYLDRVKSTEVAVRKLMDYFEGVERKTGRPYLLVVFGDHQPHSFTGTRTEYTGAADFQAMRKAVDPRVTFFHMLGTARKRVQWRDGDMAPLYLLSTLIGAYVAAKPQQQFLPVNAKAAAECGPNLFGTSAALGVDTTYQSVLGSTRHGRACPFIGSMVRSYRRDGLMRLH